MTSTKEITLEQLLDAREYRAIHQKELIESYRLPLVSFTVNIPGSVKKTHESNIIFQEGCKAIINKLNEAGCSLQYIERNGLDTGHEGYFVAKKDERTLKALMLELETEHPLGRILDLDVIGADGVPISREEFGHFKRKCLICENDAHSCARSRKHQTDELAEKIRSMVDAYLTIRL
jgi:holo-ACP synthase